MCLKFHVAFLTPQQEYALTDAIGECTSIMIIMSRGKNKTYLILVYTDTADRAVYVGHTTNKYVKCLLRVTRVPVVIYYIHTYYLVQQYTKYGVKDLPSCAPCPQPHHYT